MRERFESAEFWSDPHLGDPAFYEQVVAPWLAELDGVFAQVKAGGKLDAATVERLLDKHLFDLADFRLAIDAKRAAYIRDALFRREPRAAPAVRVTGGRDALSRKRVYRQDAQ